MKLGAGLAGLNLARKAIATATVTPFDLPKTLEMINTHAVKKCGQAFSTGMGDIAPGFTLAGRGYDALPVPGYPTCWIWCPNGYRFKVALNEERRDILAEDFQKMIDPSDLR